MLVGENGSGKSTLLEAVAIAAKAITAGSADATADPTLDGVRTLADTLRLTWTKRPGRGFFLRAEDFFGYARRLDAMRAGLEDELRRVERRVRRGRAVRPCACRLPDHRASWRRCTSGTATASTVARTVRASCTSSPSDSSRAASTSSTSPRHRCRRPVSCRSWRCSRRWRPPRSQVVVATHSPILLAYPGADLLSFDATPLRRVRYDELEHVTLTRDFLRDPEAYLRHL